MQSKDDPILDVEQIVRAEGVLTDEQVATKLKELGWKLDAEHLALAIKYGRMAVGG